MKTACPQMLISTFVLVVRGFCLAGAGLVAGPASSWASSQPVSRAKSDGIPLGETCAAVTLEQQPLLNVCFP